MHVSFIYIVNSINDHGYWKYTILIWKSTSEKMYLKMFTIQLLFKCCSFFLALLIKTNPILILWHKASVVPVSCAHWKNMFRYLNCLWNVCLFLFRFRYVWSSNKKHSVMVCICYDMSGYNYCRIQYHVFPSNSFYVYWH